VSIYLDHAATTPLRDSARAAWVEATQRGGNASALHQSGRGARSVLDDARERIGAALGAHPVEVILTSGGTEADNLAIKGLFWGRANAPGGGPRIVTTTVEHHAALDPVRWLEHSQGALGEYLPVDAEGRVSLEALRAALSDQTHGVALVSVQWANNEVGTVQPLPEVVELASTYGIPVHSDAVQTVPYVPVDFAASGLTTMAVSAHKLGGPMGVGALLARRDAPLTAVSHGGGQERKLRSGTVDVAGAAAFAAAVEEAVAEREVEAARLAQLQRELIQRIGQVVPDAVLSGPQPGAERLQGNVHFVFPGARAESLLFMLDTAGVHASNGSACTAGVVEASHVLLAMGRSEADAGATMRFSLGRTTTHADVDYLVRVLPEAVARSRAAAAR
jgi:cysteine desulfurase